MNPTTPGASTMSAGDLRDAITTAMDGGATGPALHPTRDVLIRIDENYHALKHVSIAFVHGTFVLTLVAHDQPLF